MATYIVGVKLTANSTALNSKLGYVNLRAETAKAWASVGGTLEALYLGIPAADWDLIAIGNVPSSEAIFALASMTLGTGGITRSFIQEIFNAEEADAALVNCGAQAPSAFRES